MGLIVKPIITEKMTEKGDKLNQFGFIVEKEANKLQIKQEIEDLNRKRGEARRHDQHAGGYITSGDHRGQQPTANDRRPALGESDLP